MSGEPKTLTPEKCIWKRDPTGESYVWVVGCTNEFSIDPDAEEYGYCPECGRGIKLVTAPLEDHEGRWPKRDESVRVVARDEAAAPKPIGWDDVTDEDVMAALVKAQTEANVLKRAVREWVAADAAYSEWMVLPVREDWTSGEAKARKERLEVAEAELRRLAGGENEK